MSAIGRPCQYPAWLACEHAHGFAVMLLHIFRDLLGTLQHPRQLHEHPAFYSLFSQRLQPVLPIYAM